MIERYSVKINPCLNILLQLTSPSFAQICYSFKKVVLLVVMFHFVQHLKVTYYSYVSNGFI